MSVDRVFVPLPGEGVAENDIHTMPPNGEHLKDSMWSVTELFRFENYIPLIGDMAVEAYRRRESSEPFTVLSVGCSIGAEADTVLSHVTKVAADIGSIVIRGYDISNDAVECARGGRYRITCDPEQDMSMLDLFDLTLLTKLDPPKPTGDDLLDSLMLRSWQVDTRKRYLADSNRLRAPHDIVFENRNLAEPQPPGAVPTADLVLCNRVLEHLTLDQAKSLIEGMTAYVRPGGFLSTGAIPHPSKQDHMADYVQSFGFEPVLWTNWLLQESPCAYLAKS